MSYAWPMIGGCVKDFHPHELRKGECVMMRQQ
jgi:hypothetical protein